MSRLTKILLVMTSAFLFQLAANCLPFQQGGGGTSVFPLPWLFGTGGLL